MKRRDVAPKSVPGNGLLGTPASEAGGLNVATTIVLFRGEDLCRCDRSRRATATLIGCCEWEHGEPEGAGGNSGVGFLLLPVFADVSERLFMRLSKGPDADGGAICVESKPCIQT